MTILAIDVGSSSVRAILFEANSDTVQLIEGAIVQKPYSFDTDNSGRATVDAVFLRELLESCIDDILKHDAARNISAVGIDTFVGNLLLTDGSNQPIAALDTYADTRSTDFVDQLKSQLDEKAYHQRVGTVLNSAYYPPKLCFYDTPHNAEPFVLHFCDFATYCYREWFGRDVPISYSIASWSGMLNRETLNWDEKTLKAVNWSGKMFPQLADFSEAQTGLSKKYQSRWQVLADAPFYLAVGDGAAAQVGSGAIDPNTATLTVGTTAAIRKVSTEALPTVPKGCWSYRIDKTHHLLGGALSEGGNIFAWAQDTLNLDDIDIETELSKRDPASHGLTVLPLLAGERSPNWRSDATGTIHGLRLSSTPMDILHALLESVALRLAIIAKQLHLSEDVKIMAAGGALHQSGAWSQMIADALGRDIHIIDAAEVTAMGTAQMVHSAQQGKNITAIVPNITALYSANPNYFVTYEALQEKMERLYQRVDNL